MVNRYHGGNYEKLSSVTGKKEEISALHRTPLFEAVEAGHEAIVECLLKRDANVNIRDGDGCTTLYTALDEDELDIAEMLLKHHADPNVGNMDIGDDNTLLAWSASRRKEDYVQLLLKYNADPNIPGKSGLYPLHMAARCGSKSIIQMLLKSGGDPLLKDPSGKTPIEIAKSNPKSVQAGCVDILEQAMA